MYDTFLMRAPGQADGGGAWGRGAPEGARQQPEDGAREWSGRSGLRIKIWAALANRPFGMSLLFDLVARKRRGPVRGGWGRPRLRTSAWRPGSRGRFAARARPPLAPIRLKLPPGRVAWVTSESACVTSESAGVTSESMQNRYVVPGLQGRGTMPTRRVVPP